MIVCMYVPESLRYYKNDCKSVPKLTHIEVRGTVLFVIPESFPPIMKHSLRPPPNFGSSRMARARFVNGPTAISVISPNNKNTQ